MASYFSNYLIDAIWNWFRGTTFPAVPAQMYLAAFTVKPAADGTGGTEVTGGSYARLQITPNTTNWGAPATSGSNRQIKNAAVQNFVAATANWGTIVGVGLYDASTSGNLLWYEDLGSSLAINSGFTLSFPINNLVEALNNA